MGKFLLGKNGIMGKGLAGSRRERLKGVWEIAKRKEAAGKGRARLQKTFFG